ncbi:MAG: ATP-dependent Clp protease proteolytic subunit [Lentisphaeria bacterium]|nr:ATP-dependent Clp protease proteolytic subunit [Lentisphaeria bacterium]NQZ70836.1 ATP-dependent Clp protease proteolytic subunit [Lentisphaeria bacterium]
MAWYTPSVVEEEAGGRVSFDLFSRLLKDRIVILGTEINDQIATLKIGEFLYLQSVDPNKDIQFYVNSPGGSVTAGLAIFDTMQMLSCDIQTVCVGQASSMAAILLAAGTKGKRLSLPNARIMIHQPQGGTQGTAADIKLQAAEIMRNRAKLNEILAELTGQKLKKIEEDTNRDHFMEPADAVKYGIVDEVLDNSKK